jgi:hypothetical protein
MFVDFLKRKPLSTQCAAFVNCKLSPGEEWIVHFDSIASRQVAAIIYVNSSALQPQRIATVPLTVSLRKGQTCSPPEAPNPLNNERLASALCSYMRAEQSGGPMAERRELYRSPNGDAWFLGREPTSGNAFIIHQPNAPSGGRLSHIELGEFLRSDVKGPEHQALLRLIGTLVNLPPYA